jgi:hypothetical protein
MSEPTHGTVNLNANSLCRLVPPRHMPFPLADLTAAAIAMDMPDDVSDGPDSEENLFVPAGYTYLGQFVDHDLTLDTTSSLDPNSPAAPTNLRTPAFDLDCVYGRGSADQPYLYQRDGASLCVGKIGGLAAGDDDLPRNALPFDPTDPTVPRVLLDPRGRALIGDKRNDENSIVSQIQLAFILFHNAVVQALSNRDPTLRGDALFNKARNEVRWTYQRMLLEDYLPRIVEGEVLRAFVTDWAEHGDRAYRLFHPELRSQIPIEFAGAAYRFGHSMVRTGYRLNANDLMPLKVFTQKGTPDESLTGFEPLPAEHVIDDWGRFFPHPNNAHLRPGHAPAVNSTHSASGATGTAVRLQFAYKIDPTLVAPLGDLPARIAELEPGEQGIKDKVPPAPPGQPPKREGPALGLLNLKRGNSYRLPSGQSVKHALGAVGGDMHDADLMVRFKDPVTRLQSFKHLPVGLTHATPLWIYILAEAQRHIVRDWARVHNGQPVPDDYFLEGPGARTQLGPVGGRIVVETFYGLLDADDTSYLRAAPGNWAPLVLQDAQGQATSDTLTFGHMLLWTKAQGMSPRKQFTDAFGV